MNNSFKVDFFKLKEDDIYSYNLVKASWLQKSIRRGLTNTAVSIAQTYIDEGQIKGLERKLIVICAEDIGLGFPTAILHLDEIKNPLDKVAFLCNVPKNRETDRFMLSVRTNFENLVLNKEIEQEVKCMNIVMKIVDNWVANKRLKVNKERLKNAFDVLSDRVDDNLTKEVIYSLYRNFLTVSKQKSFGYKNLVSLAVLLSVRNLKLNKKKSEILVYDKIKLDYVDDFALDKHTSFGKILNRGYSHWLKEGAPVNPELKYKEMYLNSGLEKYPYK
jgi:hypothetical protein